ncbi:MAG: hypothetical protein B6240_08700 [Desulfobacteraceae bacterium 4572_87]|nr:MAG: hypothetical protein B6240_08700 [Desulfobacteraceae bacterium 4572_87]
MAHYIQQRNLECEEKSGFYKIRQALSPYFEGNRFCPEEQAKSKISRKRLTRKSLARMFPELAVLEFVIKLI